MERSRYWQVLQPVVTEVHPPNCELEVQPGLHDSPVHDELLWQVTSQPQDTPQLMPWHEPLPPQSTLHRPLPQVMFLQLRRPVQVTAHAAPGGQTTPLLHESAREHSTLQLQPCGQSTSCLQLPAASEQSIVQLRTARLHDVHPAGHSAASGSGSASRPASVATTQNPSTQLRPAAQSRWLWHAKSSLRWLTEQLPAATIASAIAASAASASLTVHLRS